MWVWGMVSAVFAAWIAGGYLLPRLRVSGGRGAGRFLLVFLAGLLLFLGIGYAALPATNLWSIASWFVLALILAIAAMWGSALPVELRQGKTNFGGFSFAARMTLGSAMVLVLLALTMRGLPFLQMNATYRVYLHPLVVQQSVPAVNGQNLPIVPETSALAKLQNAIGSYGTQYRVGSVHIERYHGALYWIGALDFRSGYFRWLHLHSTPGYVMVSATSPDAVPVLRTGFRLVYTPNAMWNENLYRHVWFSYPQYRIGSADLETSPAGQPYYAVSVYNLVQEGAFFQNAGVILVDPQTGSMTFYKVGQAPPWVSQVVGPNTALAWARAFGLDHSSPTQVVLGQAPVMVPVGNPAGVTGPEGTLYWYIGMTSSSSSDQSLTGYLMIDAENGQIHWYSEGNGLQNAAAVGSLVDGVLQNRRLSAASPLFYNVDGRDAYIVPVVNTAGKMEEVAIADARNQATPVVATTLDQVLPLWQQYLAQGNIQPGVGSVARARKTTGTVYRIAPAGSGMYDFMLVGSHSLFSVTTGVYPYAPLVQSGDTVTLSYTVFPGSPLKTVDRMTDRSL